MNDTALETFIEENNLEGLRHLLEHQPSLATQPTSHRISPLMLACYFQRKEMADFIASKLPELSIFDTAALGKFEEATLLVFKQPELLHTYSEDGFSPLGLACHFGHNELARFFLLKGADVNSPSKNGFNVFPIHSAVSSGNIDLARLLLDAGAYPNVCQKMGIAPLHLAAQKGHIELIILLLENGAEVGLRMEGGKLPADLAAEKGFPEIAEILRDDD